MVSIANGTTLPFALGSNVLALQQTQQLINQAQLQVATGRRVNSALDNPISFFDASAFSNRAVQLNSVLDNITKQVSIIEQANDAVSSLNDLATDLQAVANSAQTLLNENPPNATLEGDRNLSAVTDLTSISGVANNDQLVFAFVDTDGSINSGNVVQIQTNDSINDLLDGINAIADTGASQVFNATINSSGQLSIATQDATRFEIDFQDNGGNANSQLVAALGFGDFTTNELNQGASETRITVSPNPSLTTVGLFDQLTNVGATATALLTDLTDNAGGSAGDLFTGDANDSINISLNGSTAIEVVSDVSTATIQDLIDGINNNGSLNTQIEATFDTATSELNIRAIANTVESLQFEAVKNNAGGGVAGLIDLQRLGIGAQALSTPILGAATTSSESIQLNSVAGQLADLETEFNRLRTQIDELVADSEFENINLLSGENLTVVFNETGTTSLTVTGGNFTVTDLGIGEANFGTSSNIDNAIDESTDALTTIESFAGSLANDLSVVNTRQTFTEETINTLNTGSDDLTSVDQGEAEALLLSLQARQQLSVFSLSLGAQSQLSSLRLF